MEQSLQAVSTNQRIVEWSQRITACRNSGLSVRQWCRENEIREKTYFYWQRRVFNALTERNSPYFAEVPAERLRSRGDVSVTVRIGDTEADIYAGADCTTVEAVLRSLK